MRLQRRGTVLVVALWRLCSSAPGLLNIYNKLVLKAFSFPYTITAFQFAFSSLLIFLMSVTRLHSVPKLSPTLLAKIMSLDVGHMLGTEFTNMSLGKVVVSFMHTVKASEPFFTILLSAFFLGETPFLLVLGSLVPRCRLGIFDRCFFQLD